MATIESHDMHTTASHAHDSTAEVATGISLGESIGGLAVLVLAIIGLAGIYPTFLTGICAIVLGAALLLEGSAMMARFSQATQHDIAGAEEFEGGLAGGTTAELLGGVAGIVLGILALLNIFPWVLLPVSALVFGATLILGAGSGGRTLSHRFGGAGFQGQQRVIQEMAHASCSAKLLVGLSALILGVLAVTGIATANLTLVAFLCLGAAVCLSGMAVSTKMMSFLHMAR